MSKLKITPNLFLHSAELNRLMQFMDQDGFRSLLLAQTAHFGLIKNDPFTNFRLESGTAQGTLRLRGVGTAINQDGQLLSQQPFDNLAVPSDGQWRWVKASYQSSPNEAGTVAVDSFGNLSGTNTRFTEVLRGQPNFASTISFPNSGANVQQYEVVQVLSDSQAILAGGAIYQPEANLSYKVVGTFNPDFVAPQSAQDIFQYDGCRLDFLLETSANTAPPKLAGNEFYLARVRYDGAAVVIEDKRSEFWTSKGQAEVERFNPAGNPLVGIESIKWSDDYSTGTDNLVFMGWGFRSDNWTIDPVLNRLTLIAGNGGRYLSTADFTDSAFNGWRVYGSDGNYTRVVASTKAGSQINLTLEVLNPDRFIAGQLLSVVPDCEEIEFSFEHDPDLDNSTLLNANFRFPISAGIGRCEVLVPEDTYYYIIKYRTRQVNQYSKYRILPESNPGCLTEKSFDLNGVLFTDPNRVSRQRYNGTAGTGYVRFVCNPRSFRKFTQKIDLGDALGVTVRNLDTANPVVSLIAGTDKQHQIFTTEGNLGLTVDLAINLSTQNAREGNIFFLDFEAKLTPGAYRLGVYSDYQNAGSTGTSLKIFSRTEFDYMKLPRRKVSLKAVFTGKTWKLSTLETDTSKLGEVRPFDYLTAADFDESGLGVAEEFLGWALCNGQNGTPNLSEKFIVGVNPARYLDGSPVQSGKFQVGNTGGSEQTTLTGPNIPKHRHQFSGEGAGTDGSGSSDRIKFLQDGDSTNQNKRQNAQTSYYGGAADGTTAPFNTLPPFYALAYLKRVLTAG